MFSGEFLDFLFHVLTLSSMFICITCGCIRLFDLFRGTNLIGKVGSLGENLMIIIFLSSLVATGKMKELGDWGFEKALIKATLLCVVSAMLIRGILILYFGYEKVKKIEEDKKNEGILRYSATVLYLASFGIAVFYKL